MSFAAEGADSELEWLERLPKVELHLHLEGAIPRHALWELIRKYGGDPSVPDSEALARRFQYRDFPHFIETWIWKNQFLREYDDFALIAEGVARDLARQNVLYAECFYSPYSFERFGLTLQRITESVRRGLARVPELEVALMLDFSRDNGPREAERTLAAVAEVLDMDVVGVGLGGSEKYYPPAPFAPVYERARALCLHTTAHAGEAAGAGSIWGAIRALRVERIGHGTRAHEDERLLDYLAEQRIPLEMCPLSNLRTGVVRSICEHPLRRYLERGIPVTVSTDDPAMFGNSLAEEYLALEREQGLTREDVRGLILQAVAASWLPEERKSDLAARLRADPAWGDGGRTRSG